MNTERIEDLEIYNIAADILNKITQGVRNEFYVKKLGGSLRFSFSEEPRVTAWASSKGDPTLHPDHEVVFSYELVRQLYRQIEGYYGFATSTLLEEKEPLTTLLKHLDPRPKLPDHTSKNDVILIMFISAITWVFFHELGHLDQEHGHIRSLFGGKGSKTLVEDCAADDKETLKGQAAAVSHVTEFAADVHATVFSLLVLKQNFLFREEATEAKRQKDFKDNLYLMVCGMSSVFYLFNGERPLDPVKETEGSHPTPIRRLELCVPNIYERLDLDGKLHGMSRKELVHLCVGAAESVGYYWLWPYVNPETIKYLIGGVLQDPYKTSYWKEIVLAWDKVKPEIENIRRFGDGLSMLSFTDKLRAEIFVE